MSRNAAALTLSTAFDVVAVIWSAASPRRFHTSRSDDVAAPPRTRDGRADAVSRCASGQTSDLRLLPSAFILPPSASGSHGIDGPDCEAYSIPMVMVATNSGMSARTPLGAPRAGRGFRHRPAAARSYSQARMRPAHGGTAPPVSDPPPPRPAEKDEVEPCSKFLISF
jgi:hypothetical protein